MKERIELSLEQFGKLKAIEFNISGLADIRGPGVYMYCAGDEAVYVGASRKVVGRILARNHHIADGLDAASSLLIFPCADWKTAQALETVMITTLRPRLNRRNYKTLRAREVANRLGITLDRAIKAYEHS